MKKNVFLYVNIHDLWKYKNLKKNNTIIIIWKKYL